MLSLSQGQTAFAIPFSLIFVLVAGDLFAEGIKRYQVVADRLGQVSESYPWTPEGGETVIPLNAQCHEMVTWLKEAREAEAACLGVLEKIVAALA